MIRRPPSSPLFPYPPLSRSIEIPRARERETRRWIGGQPAPRTPQERGGGAHEERSEEHTSELQSQSNLVCRLLLEKKKKPRQNPSPMEGCPTHAPAACVACA